MRCLLCTFALVSFVGCQSHSTGVANPFLAPDRVPPPATRAQVPGTALPYYPGDPVPGSTFNSAPQNFQPTQTFAPQPTTPQPAGVSPPGGWNTTPQPFNSGANVVPNNIQPANAFGPVAGQAPVQVQQDQFDLRFAPQTPQYQPPQYQPLTNQPIANQPTTFSNGQTLPPDPSILPTPRVGALPGGNQLAGFQSPVAQPVAQNIEPRQVQIRAISSSGIGEDGQPTGNSFSRDGFRPQGSSRVRKPAVGTPSLPRDRGPVREASDRFGFEPHYQWLRGQLQHSSATGQWTLRYIPIQSGADQFGGNLTIANPQVLGNLQPGDFVQLRGRLDGAGVGAPIYTVSVVQRQRI